MDVGTVIVADAGKRTGLSLLCFAEFVANQNPHIK